MGLSISVPPSSLRAARPVASPTWASTDACQWLTLAGVPALVLSRTGVVEAMLGPWVQEDTSGVVCGAVLPCASEAAWDLAWRRLWIEGQPQGPIAVMLGGQPRSARLGLVGPDACGVTFLPVAPVPALDDTRQAVSMLIQGTGHDLNHIFGVLQTQVGMLRDDLDQGLTAEATQDIADIGNIVARAQRVSRQVQQLGSQLSGTPPVLQLEPLRLSPIVADAGAFLRRLLGHDTVVTMDLADTDPPIWGARTALERVLLNLGSNIRDAFVRRGEGPPPAVSLRVESTEHWVVLSVSDNAGGIAPDLFARLGEAGVSGNAGPDRGVGMRAMQQIVAQHHGQMELRTRDGVGTECRLLFPVADHSHVPHAVPRPRLSVVVDAGSDHAPWAQLAETMAAGTLQICATVEELTTQLLLAPPDLVLVSSTSTGGPTLLPALTASRVYHAIPTAAELAEWAATTTDTQRRLLTDSSFL